MDIKKIESYIEKVAKDAFLAEERQGKFQFQVCCLDDTVMLAFKTGYDRVDRRIVFRLVNNFQRNFGYRLFIKLRYAMLMRRSSGVPDKFHLEAEDVDINHTIAYCRMLGKWSAVNCYYKTGETAAYLNPDFDNDADYSIIYKKMEELVENPSGFEGKRGWDEYCRLYNELYGFTPRAQEKLEVFPQKEVFFN